MALRVKQYGKSTHSNMLVDQMHFGKVVIFQHGDKNKVALPFEFTGSYFKAVDLTDMPDKGKVFMLNKLNTVDFSDRKKAQDSIKKTLTMIYSNKFLADNVERFYYSDCGNKFVALHSNDHAGAILSNADKLHEKFF